MHCQKIHFFEFTPENTVEAFWSLLLLRTGTVRGPRRGQWQCRSLLGSTHPSFCLKYAFLKLSSVWKLCWFSLLLDFLLQLLPDLSSVWLNLFWTTCRYSTFFVRTIPWLISWYFMLFSKVCPEVMSLYILFKSTLKTNNRKYRLRKMKNLDYF